MHWCRGGLLELHGGGKADANAVIAALNFQFRDTGFRHQMDQLTYLF